MCIRDSAQGERQLARFNKTEKRRKTHPASPYVRGDKWPPPAPSSKSCFNSHPYVRGDTEGDAYTDAFQGFNSHPYVRGDMPPL